jgi:septum site-determining protein MinC
MSKDIVNIKGTRNGLVICLEAGHDFDEIKNTLISKIESSRGFFKGAKFIFHLGLNSLTSEKTKELEDICYNHGLVPNADIPLPSKNISKPVQPLMREASPSLPSTGLIESDKKPCLMVNHSLRSGQKVNYKGNVVIMGDINPGSEITALGDIIVLGSLRGVVHAGANGDMNSIIVAYRLNPVQLRIASTISRSPENNLISRHPEIARMHNGQMVIEPYLTRGLK